MNKLTDIEDYPNIHLEDEILNDLDLNKMLRILRKSILWIILVNLIFISGAYLYLRYTKPLYRSESSLKLSIDQNQRYVQNASGVLIGENDGFKELLGELEFIQSDIILQEVLNKSDLEVSYFSEGNVINSENFNNNPFRVEGLLKNPEWYDFPFFVQILDSQRFILSYERNGVPFQNTYKFSETISSPAYDMEVILNNSQTQPETGQRFFFIFNSEKSLYSLIKRNLSAGITNREARTITISFTDYNRHKARKILATIDTTYMQKSVEEKNRSNDRQLAFLNGELARYEDSLIIYESRMQNFILDNETDDINQKLETSIEAIQEFSTQKSVLSKQIVLLDELEGLLKQDTNQVDILPILPLIENEAINEKVKAVIKFRKAQKINLLREKEGKTYRSRKLSEQVAQSEAEIANLIRVNRRLLREKIRELNIQIQEVQNSLAGLPIKGREFNRISRLYKQYEDYYGNLLNKRTEIQIAGAGIVPKFIILSPANIPVEPISPKRTFIYLVAVAAGLFVSLGIVVIKYLLHNTISGQAELEKILNAPVLGIVPEYKRMRRSKLVANRNPKSSLNESLRSIRTNLDFLLPPNHRIYDEQPTVISVSSTISGEGKTFIVANLGGIIALSDLKVIVLDFDMRKPKLHTMFDVENEQGISSILIGKRAISECIRETEIPGLHFITSGPTPPNPSELILREDLEILLDNLRKTYDVILIDTPPVGLVTDGILIMKKVDLPIYVVRANYSKKSFIKNIRRLIKDNNFSNLAIVLNSVSTMGYSNYGRYYVHGYYDDESPKNRLFNWIRQKFTSQN